MASVAVAQAPVQRDDIDPEFYTRIGLLNNEYDKYVSGLRGGPMDSGSIFSLFMIMITIMSANAEVYSNAFALSGVATRAAFKSTLVGMAFEFSYMVAMGQDESTSDVAKLLGDDPLLIDPLKKQAQLIKYISVTGETDRKRSPFIQAKTRSVGQSRAVAVASAEGEEYAAPIEIPGSNNKKRKVLRGGYFEGKTKIAVANVIMASAALAGTAFAINGGLLYITKSLINAMSTSGAFQESSHCLTFIGYSKNWFASAASAGVKSCSAIISENDAAADFIMTKVQLIVTASIAAVGGFSYAAWGNIRNLIIRFLIDPLDQAIDWMNPPPGADKDKIVKKFIDGLITTSAAASWQQERDVVAAAAAAGNPGAQNKWVLAANKDEGQRPKLYFNFTQSQFDQHAITIQNLTAVTIRAEAVADTAPESNFPNLQPLPASASQAAREARASMPLDADQQNNFYNIIKALETQQFKRDAEANLPVVAALGQAQGVQPQQQQQQPQGTGGKKRRRTMKKKKYHRKNKTGKKKHHKKKHHKKHKKSHKKSHKKHHKKHGRKTRKH